MSEEKVVKKPAVKAPAPAKAPPVPKPTHLDWVAIGREVETVLGLDDDEANVIKGLLAIYPAVKRHVVKPLANLMKEQMKGGVK